jgi:16S rRNA (cytidine1402-2'-O)-methyltransferase
VTKAEAGKARRTGKRSTGAPGDGEPPAAREAAASPSTRSMPGGLYVVATPLGHLDDFSERARQVLVRADRIYAEDTRVTATLLARAGIGAPARSLHAHNEARRTDEVLAALAAGEVVALVSDAGTPAISDPGARVVRAAHEGGHRVVPIPGPSAVAAAVSAAGLAAERFVFVGFLPTRDKARSELLARLGRLPLALVVYEAPHRVRATLAALARELDPARTLIVARELTKTFEEIARMPLREATAWLDAKAHRERGEFVLVVDAPLEDQHPADTASLGDDSLRWLAALAAELPPAQAARIAAAATGLPRELLYREALVLRGREPGGAPTAGS